LRLLYICLAYCLLPFVLAAVLWRGLRDRAYREALPERFGYGPRAAPGGIWVHAVSVGEVQAAAPLLRALRARHPGLPLVLTTATPTGRQRARSLLGTEVSVRWLPYDLPGPVGRFLDRVAPRLAIVLETELWPNLYRACSGRRIPLVLASARLGERSVARYRLLARLIRDTLRRGVMVAAQSEADAARFIALGADPARTHVTGNVKFDFELAEDTAARGAALRTALGVAARPVWVAGSTHEGEEEVVLAAHARVRARLPDALLVLVPRHPPRFDSVAATLRRRGTRFVTRSSGVPVAAGTEVLLGDTLGELTLFYAAADVAFVGGSLVPVGGHNLLEPAALGLPILTGPHTFSAPAVAGLLLEAGAAQLVTDADSLAARVGDYLAEPEARSRDGGAARAVLAANRGALARVLALIEPLLDRPT
jgi:3-deoxy-D-manno-octulosonic-acid transferase